MGLDELIRFNVWGVDVKQWIPGFGLLYAERDSWNNEPSLFDGGNAFRDSVATAYHFTAILAPIITPPIISYYLRG